MSKPTVYGITKTEVIQGTFKRFCNDRVLFIDRQGSEHDFHTSHIFFTFADAKRAQRMRRSTPKNIARMN